MTREKQMYRATGTKTTDAAAEIAQSDGRNNTPQQQRVGLSELVGRRVQVLHKVTAQFRRRYGRPSTLLLT